MANDPRDLDGKALKKAMHMLGRNTELRKEFIKFLMVAEDSLESSGSIRDEITGPIVDALHDDNDVYEKSLIDGTRFKFLFRTKIARDFLMASKEHPSHVWEPQTTKLLLHLTKDIQGDVIVGGAYFGDQAVLVAKNINPAGHVIHCFEPNLDQAKMLEDNFQLNKLDNVQFNKLGLWSTSSVHLKLDGFDSFANAIEAAPGDDGFETVSIDDYRRKLNIDVALIQLDIEGAELGTLQGASETIVKYRPNIVFEVHRDYVDWSNGLENTEICQLLLNAGYSVFAIRDFNTHYEMVDKPVELIPIDKVFLEGPPHGFNMVAITEESLFDVSKFKIVENVSPKLLLHKDPKIHHPVCGL